ncbi:MAG: serpin family protein [Lachnospiraceae bacterium]
MKNLLKRIFSLSLCVCLLLSQTGCHPDNSGMPTNGTDSGNNIQNESSSPSSDKSVNNDNSRAAKQTIDLMSGYSSQRTDKETADVSEDFQRLCADFSLRLFRQSAADGKKDNMMISPLSIMTALSMTANGAAGETQKQMLDLLCGDSAASFTMEDFNRNMSSLLNRLPSDPDSRLLQANSIWFLDDQNEFQVRPDFLQTNADYYLAEIYQAPFDNKTLSDINNWVADHTEQMIPSILDEIPDNAIMYLINALAFDAAWASPYFENDIRDGEFTNENGTTSQVSMMYSEENLYLQLEHASGFIKPYKQGYSFAALLPDEGLSLDDFLTGLTGDSLHQALSNPSEETVETCLPRFSVKYDTELSETLIHMGMELPFDSKKADFSGLGTCPDSAGIFISRVIHKTTISIDGNGTRAGAATAVEIAKESCMINTRSVRLTRPFLYLIIDQKTNTPVFMGIVTNLPSVSR